MAELELRVEGMMCGGCENSVQKVVAAVAGVESVKADHKAAKVLVTGDGVERDAVVKSIEDAGYKVLAM